ncbi:sperm microtubule inner protein 11 isoform X2 [Rhinoderma darwinii]|uniref:sperm microtubule inner protein 11 isoform X2 n=1 Tax=Rhinoderma darwinii TaxID=43563 RepID=UPI003F679882
MVTAYSGAFYAHHGNRRRFLVVLIMAFFGITGLGYQAPLRAAQIPGGENVENGTKLPPLVPTSPYVSYGKYQEIIRRHQHLRTPKQTQKTPLTAAQQYGWWLPQDPKEKPENVYPWIQSTRYPMINSPMTSLYTSCIHRSCILPSKPIPSGQLD